MREVPRLLLQLDGRERHRVLALDVREDRDVGAEEAAVARAPEVILLADHAGSGSEAGRAAPEKWQALTSVPAIRAGRLHSVNLDVLHRYGPRIADGLESLARLIHPEAFP